MNELKKTLKLTTEKYKKEYASVCEPLDGLVSRQNNALKFDPINKKLITEITENMNDYLEQNPESDRNKVIETGQDYIKIFARQLINPFS